MEWYTVFWISVGVFVLICFTMNKLDKRDTKRLMRQCDDIWRRFHNHFEEKEVQDD